MPQHLSKDQEKYFKDLDIFFDKQNPKDLVDHFPLFLRREYLIYYLTKYELVKKILNIKGSIVECGVWKGSSLLLMSKLMSIFEPYGIHRKIIGFDTFKGFLKSEKEDIPKDKSINKKIYKKGFKGDTNLELINNCIKFYDMNRPNGHLSKIELVKGDAIKTIPNYIKNNPHLLISLLYIDFDLYEPTRVALKNFIPRMSKGSIIAFDELNQKRWQGETLALLKELKINEHSLQQFPFEPNISYIVL